MVNWQLFDRLLNRANPPLRKRITDEVKKYEHEVLPPLITTDDLPSKIPYEYRTNIITPNLHIGQRKLYLTELEFLNLYYAKRGGKSQSKVKSSSASVNNTPIIVYAGAAPSNHTFFLHELFPDIKWVLVDPAPFELYLDTYRTSHRTVKHDEIIHLKTGTKSYSGNRVNIDLKSTNKKEVCKFIQETPYKFYIIEDFMTIDLAKTFEPLNCLFISDIRTNSNDTKGTSGVANANIDLFPLDLDVIWNNAQQYNWIRTIKPQMFMVKFRTYYYDNNPEEKMDNHPIIDDLKYAKDKYKIDFMADYRKHQVKFLVGKLYLQCYAPFKSTETRIIGSTYEKNMTIDNSDYESQMFYFNVVQRSFIQHVNPMEDPSKGCDRCNDCAKQTFLLNQYAKLFPNNRINMNKVMFQLNFVSNKTLLNPPNLQISHGAMFGINDKFLERIWALRHNKYRDHDDMPDT